MSGNFVYFAMSGHFVYFATSSSRIFLCKCSPVLSNSPCPAVSFIFAMVINTNHQYFCAVCKCVCSDMELENLLNSTVWAFQISAFYTNGADRASCGTRTEFSAACGRNECARGTGRSAEYLHRACCDVSDLITEIESWLTRWPQVMAVLAVAAEGAHLHPGIMEFYFSRELPSMSAASSKRLEAAAWGSSWNSSRKENGALRVRQWSSSSPSRWRPGTWCRRCWRGSPSFSGKAPVDLACPHFTPWLARLSMFQDWLVYTMFYAMIGLFTHVLCHDWLMYLCFIACFPMDFMPW